MSHTWTSERVALALTAATTAVLGARFLRSLSTTSGSSFPALKGIKDASSDNGQLFTDRSLTRLLAAFAPDGLNATGRDAKGHRPGSGAMIASPSRPEDYINKVIENDDYYFQWPRDSGICVRQVVRAWKKALRGESVGAMGGVKWLREALASARKGADQTTKTTFRGTDGLVTAADLEKIIQDFARMNYHLQKLENPSGTFETGGLGEPKFLIDGTPFDASWGRPQNDGPPLRSLALISYAWHVIEHFPGSSPSASFVWRYLLEGASESKDTEHRIINADLDYICRVWKEDGYEPWEEVNAGYGNLGQVGGHFYVLMAERQALLVGSKLVRSVQGAAAGSADKWDKTAKEITQVLEKYFWNPKGEMGKEGDGTDGPLSDDAWNDHRRHLTSVPQALLTRPHLLPTLNRRNGQQKPLQVDTQTLLAFTHAGDGTWHQDLADAEWAPWNEKCLATLDRLVEVFAIVYELNAGRDTTTQGVLCGRYPEDIYDGKVTSVGHPWFICTHAITEVLSLAANHFAHTGSIQITTFTQAFFQRFEPTVHAGEEVKQIVDERFELIVRGMRTMADAYLFNAQSYAGKDARMDEQIERVTGTMRGARELTWSYASRVSAWDARQGGGVDIASKSS